MGLLKVTDISELEKLLLSYIDDKDLPLYWFWKQGDMLELSLSLNREAHYLSFNDLIANLNQLLEKKYIYIYSRDIKEHGGKVTNLNIENIEEISFYKRHFERPNYLDKDLNTMLYIGLNEKGKALFPVISSSIHVKEYASLLRKNNAEEDKKLTVGQSIVYRLIEHDVMLYDLWRKGYEKTAYSDKDFSFQKLLNELNSLVKTKDIFYFYKQNKYDEVSSLNVSDQDKLHLLDIRKLPFYRHYFYKSNFRDKKTNKLIFVGLTKKGRKKL